MKLLELYLDGFGRLTGRAFTFAPGLNVIYGPNEVGKSTLQQALVALLYGFYDAGRVTEAKRAALAGFQPWQAGAAYAGSLVYALDDGAAFKVVRKFAPSPTVRLLAHPVGEDVSAQFPQASQGRLYFADAHLGVDKTVFEAACTVRQAQLVALDESASAITDTLTRLSASASADTAAAEALAALEAALKEQVGSARAWAKPLPQAQQRLAALEDERRRVSQARREAFTQGVALRQAEERLRALEEARRRQQYLQTAAEAVEIRRQLEAAAQAETEVQRLAEEMARWQAWADFPAGLHDPLTRLASQRDALRVEVTRLAARAQQAQAELDPLRTRLRAAECQVAALSDAREVQTEALPRVRQLTEQWRLAVQTAQAAQERQRKAAAALREAEQRLAEEQAAVGPVIDLGHAGLAQMQQRLTGAREQAQQAAERLAPAEAAWAHVGWSEGQFCDLERQVQEIQSGARPAPPPRKGCRLWLFGRRKLAHDQPPTELVIYAQIQPIQAAWRQAQDEAASAQQHLAQVEAAARTHLGGVGVDSLDDDAFVAVSRRLEQHGRAVAAVDQQRAAVAALLAETESAQSAASTARQASCAELRRLGFDADDPQVASEAYAAQCRRQAEWERAVAAAERLRLEAQALEREVQAWQEKQAALAQIEGELCATLAQAGMDCAPGAIDATLARFADGRERHARWVKAQAAGETVARQAAKMLDSATRARQASALAELEAALAAQQAAHPDWATLQPEASAQEYARRLQQSEKDWTATQGEYQRLKDALARAADAERHPAEVDEEIAEVQAQIHALEQFRAALELARTELAQATQEFQRQFAPQLERRMHDGLRRITHERYTEACVDPTTLAVSLVAPETQTPVGVERLSTGTRDLIYLLLRVSLAGLMSSTGERLPLLLDEPLVQYDRARQMRALDFLVGLAEETQVLLFTKDEWIREWFEQAHAESQAHRLLGLG